MNQKRLMNKTSGFGPHPHTELLLLMVMGIVFSLAVPPLLRLVNLQPNNLQELGLRFGLLFLPVLIAIFLIKFAKIYANKLAFLIGLSGFLILGYQLYYWLNDRYWFEMDLRWLMTWLLSNVMGERADSFVTNSFWSGILDFIPLSLLLILIGGSKWVNDTMFEPDEEENRLAD